MSKFDYLITTVQPMADRIKSMAEMWNGDKGLFEIIIQDTIGERESSSTFYIWAVDKEAALHQACWEVMDDESDDEEEKGEYVQELMDKGLVQIPLGTTLAVVVSQQIHVGEHIHSRLMQLFRELFPD